MYQRILVAVDGSHSSDLAVSQAIMIAKATRSEVKALFVADNSDLLYDVGYFDPSQLMESMLAWGRETLAAAARRLDEAGIPHSVGLVETPVAPGNISGTIVQEADMWNADLIVLGTHGRRGVKRLVMGSVAEGVVRKTNRPVLLIRSEMDQ